MLKLVGRKRNLGKWQQMVDDTRKAKEVLKIALVAKYISSGEYMLEDSYICVNEALKHAATTNLYKLEFKWVDAQALEKMSDREISKVFEGVLGIVVPQGWGSRGTEGKIKAVQFARENKIPFLGLCFGMQMAAIEFARNVLRFKGANSTEVNPKTKHPVIHIMPLQEKYLKAKQYGGTIRLGAWDCRIAPHTLLSKIYGKTRVSERHRHRYEFNNNYRHRFERAGVHFSGLSPDRKLVEALELDQKLHPFFLGVQFHPELKSRPLSPHPIFVSFVKAVVKQTALVHMLK